MTSNDVHQPTVRFCQVSGRIVSELPRWIGEPTTARHNSGSSPKTCIFTARETTGCHFSNWRAVGGGSPKTPNFAVFVPQRALSPCGALPGHVPAIVGWATFHCETESICGLTPFRKRCYKLFAESTIGTHESGRVQIPNRRHAWSATPLAPCRCARHDQTR